MSTFTPRVSLAKWSGGSGGSGWTLRVEDEASGLRILEFDMTPEEFTAIFNSSPILSGKAQVNVPRYLGRRPRAIKATISTKVWDLPVEDREAAVVALLATTDEPGLDWDVLSPITAGELRAARPNPHHSIGNGQYEIHVLKYEPLEEES